MELLLLTVIYLAFISLGLPDGVFGVAWPDIRIEFGQPIQAAGIISILLMSFSALSSFTSGRVVGRFGTGKVTFISCLMTGLALWGYGLSPSYLWLIALAIPLGLGQGAVDSGLNNYVAQNYSSRHMNWLHCCWGIGASLGPFIMTWTMAHGGTWRGGYGHISLMQIVLALILLLSLKLWKKNGSGTENASETHIPGQTSKLFKLPAAWLGVLLFFVYAGAEFSVGLWANSFLVESRHIPKTSAGLWITWYYGALMFGRFVTGLIVNQLGNRTLIRLGLGISGLGALCLFIPGYPILLMVGLILMGFGYGPLYPCMMHETSARFDPVLTRTLIGYQVGTACLGGSLLTAGLGVLLGWGTLEILLPCLVGMIGTLFLLSEWQNRLS